MSGGSRDGVRDGGSEGALPRTRGADPRVVGRGRRLPAFARAPRGSAHVDLLRGPTHRERQARHPSRRAAHVQGRLSAVQDDDRSPRAAQRRLGLPRTAGRDRGRETDRHHREEGHRGVRRRRVQPALPGVGAALRRRVRTPHATDRLLDRHVRRLPDDGHGLHRVGVVVAEGAPSPRVVGRGPQGHRVLPAMRHGPVRRGGGARVRPDGRPERVRPVAGRGGAGSLARGRLARDLDDDAVDPPVEHRRRRGRGGRLRRGRGRGRTAGARRVAAAGRPGRGRRGPRDPSRRGAGRRALRAAVPERRGRAHGGRRRLRHPRGRHRDRPPGAGVRRGGPGGRQGERLAGLAAGRRRRPVHGPRADVRARRLRQGRGSARSSRTCARAASSSRRRPTSTPTRSAGGARRRSCTTRGRPGTPARRP